MIINMKNTHKLLLPLAVLILAMGSCKKEYLETQPTDRVSSNTVFTTTANALAALNGIHRLLYSQYSSQEQGGQGSVNLSVDYMGEDLYNSINTTAYSAHRWVTHRSATTAANSFVYTMYYRIIVNANYIIEGIDAAEGPEADKRLIKAEALTYRAWAHYQLVQFFGKRYDAAGNNTQLGIPIQISTAIAATPGNPRASVEAVYTQINADLDLAITTFAGATARPFKSHFNLAVAKGIKARVALTQGRWAVAAQNASEAKVGQTLMSTTDYLGGFNSINNAEWMWGSMQQEDQTTYFYSFFAYMGSFNSTANRTNPKRISSSLYAAIPATDIRKSLWDPTGTNTAFPIPAGGIRSTFMQRKFTNAGATSIGDLPNMRTAEMYLIESEARARLGIAGAAAETTAAQTLISTLGRARNTAYGTTTLTGTALLNEILFQRRIELWGEGFRFFDLKRMDLPMDRNGTQATLAISGILRIEAGTPDWQWMIPQAEIDANPAIGPGGQNP